MFIICLIILKTKNKQSIIQKSELKELVWIFGIFCLTFICATFIGGKDFDIRYIYHIIPFGYIVSIALIEKLLHGIKPQRIISYAATTEMVSFAFFNAAYGTSKNLSEYLFRGTAYVVHRIGTYSELPILVIAERDAADVVTGNLKAFELFDKVYMSSKDGLNNDFIKTDDVLKNGSCVIYIMVDKYCTDGHGYDLESTLNDIIEDSDSEYDFISEGRFGEFYYIHPIND